MRGTTGGTPAVGRSGRRAWDFYETPAAVTDALVAVLPLKPGASVYEPCVGDGAIVRRLPRTPMSMSSSRAGIASSG